VDALDPATLAALLAGSDDPLVVCGPDDSVVWANAAAGRVTGHASTTLLGLPLSAVQGDRRLLVVRAGPPATTPWVLVVDDNDVNRTLLQRMLEVVGVNADVAADGESALAAAAGRAYDVVLMDVRMPDEDGPSVTRRLHGVEQAAGSRRTPVVAVTGSATSAERERCRQAGMEGFLAKPVALAELRHALAPFVTLPAGAPRAATPRAVAPDRAPAAAPASDVPVLERHRLTDLAEQLGDDALVRETVRTYLEEMPHRREALAAALDGDDRDSLKLVSHSLKSSSAMLGAAALATCCLAVERASAVAPREDLARLMAAVEAAAPAAVTALEDWLAGR
jgi:CheY-like chemotaxis protein